LGKVVVPALQDQDPPVGKLALQRMTDATDPPLQAMAEMVLKDERATLRSSAIDTLVGIHGAAAAQRWGRALRDPSPAVRRAAQQGLEWIRQLEERIIHKQQ
jgi:HEAT repeat protein